MKIAIPILNEDIHSAVDPHFGRCKYFCLADTSDGSRRIIDNSESVNSMHGAGLHAVQTIAAAGADTVVTGQLGPKATGALKAAGIHAFSIESGTVDEALAKLEKNELEPLV